MAREFSKTNLTIWQDAEWRDLPWPAQHVYKMLWEHPSLSYCGVVDWRPAKLLGWGAGWKREHMDAAIDCLRARHFIVIDDDTEECLIRSWIRWDGLIRQPRLAVSLSKAFAEVGSNVIRGAIIHELRKLREREPDAHGWTKPNVASILDMTAINAKEIDVPEDPFASGFDITFGIGLESVSVPVSEAFGRNGSKRLGSVSVPPTTSTSTSTSNINMRSDESEACASADAERESVDDEFDVWWSEYPRKRGKGQAIKAYRSARKQASADELLAALIEQTPALIAKGLEYAPYPATWLNGLRWEDELDSNVRPIRQDADGRTPLPPLPPKGFFDQ